MEMFLNAAADIFICGNITSLHTFFNTIHWYIISNDIGYLAATKEFHQYVSTNIFKFTLYLNVYILKAIYKNVEQKTFFHIQGLPLDQTEARWVLKPLLYLL